MKPEKKFVSSNRILIIETVFSKRILFSSSLLTDIQFDSIISTTRIKSMETKKWQNNYSAKQQQQQKCFLSIIISQPFWERKYLNLKQITIATYWKGKKRITGKNNISRRRNLMNNDDDDDDDDDK